MHEKIYHAIQGNEFSTDEDMRDVTLKDVLSEDSDDGHEHKDEK